MPDHLFEIIQEDWIIHRSWRMRATFILYRLGHACHRNAEKCTGIRRFAWRLCKGVIFIPYRRLIHSFGSYLPFSVRLGRRVRFGHDPYGVFISADSSIGDDGLIMQQVTIGADYHAGREEGSPTIGQRVFIGAGAKIIGPITIGDDCRIGANAIVVDDLPANVTAVSSKARIIQRPNQNRND